MSATNGIPGASQIEELEMIAEPSPAIKQPKLDLEPLTIDDAPFEIAVLPKGGKDETRKIKIMPEASPSNADKAKDGFVMPKPDSIAERNRRV